MAMYNLIKDYKNVQLMIAHTIVAGQKTLKASKITPIHRFRGDIPNEADVLNSKRSKQLCTEVQDGKRSVILLVRPPSTKV